MRLMDRKHAMRVHVNLRRYFTCTSSYNVREQRAVGPKIACIYFFKYIICFFLSLQSSH